MLKLLSKSLGSLLIIVVAIGINFLFFIVIPLTHDLFGKVSDTNKNALNNPKIIAELIRPPKKEEKKQEPRKTRQINTPQGQKGLANRMDFKFQPDLDVGSSGDGVVVQQQGNMDAVIFNEGETDEDAVPLSTPTPQYPQRAREMGIEGVVEAIIIVGTDGKVTSVDIVKSPDASFKTEVTRVIKTWKFKPAKNQGVPVIQKKKQVIEYWLNS